jgi:hypothetical protein
LQNDDDVKIVVGKNFDDIVLDESKDTLLEVSGKMKMELAISNLHLISIYFLQRQKRRSESFILLICKMPGRLRGKFQIVMYS